MIEKAFIPVCCVVVFFRQITVHQITFAAERAIKAALGSVMQCTHLVRSVDNVKQSKECYRDSNGWAIHHRNQWFRKLNKTAHKLPEKQK